MSEPTEPGSLGPRISLFHHALRLHRRDPGSPLPDDGEPYPDEAAHNRRAVHFEPDDPRHAGMGVTAVLEAHAAHLAHQTATMPRYIVAARLADHIARQRPERQVRGRQRHNIQLMLSARHAGLDDVPITRTTLRLTPTGLRLSGDPALFQCLATVIDIAVADLGADEWRMRTGTGADAASAFAVRLRDEPVPADGASWHELHASADEITTARATLGELAYGTTRQIPDDATRPQIMELLEELRRQCDR